MIFAPSAIGRMMRCKRALLGMQVVQTRRVSAKRSESRSRGFRPKLLCLKVGAETAGGGRCGLMSAEMTVLRGMSLHITGFSTALANERCSGRSRPSR